MKVEGGAYAIPIFNDYVSGEKLALFAMNKKNDETKELEQTGFSVYRFVELADDTVRIMPASRKQEKKMLSLGVRHIRKTLLAQPAETMEGPAA